MFDYIGYSRGVRDAALFALGAHAAVGQVRKYTGDPYIVHPATVAEIVSRTPDVGEDMIMAALLHDVVEDTAVTIDVIEELFGFVIGSLVFDLTDEYTKEKYPDLNRAERKLREAKRYAWAGYEVKTIKLADGIDNTTSIVRHDPEFLKTYGPEKRQLLEALRGGDKTLWNKLDRILTEAGY